MDNLDAGIPTDAPEPLALAPGEYGILIRPGNGIDLLVPPGEEDKPLAEAHEALLGAAISVLRDPEMRKDFAKLFRVELTPANQVAA